MAPKTQSAARLATALKFESSADEEKLKFTLISYLEENRCLWNPADENYRNYSYKEKVWSDFIETYYKDRPNITVNSLKKTWKGLKDAFTRTNKKSGENETNWKYFNSLTFLREIKENSVEENDVEDDTFTSFIIDNGVLLSDANEQQHHEQSITNSHPATIAKYKNCVELNLDNSKQVNINSKRKLDTNRSKVSLAKRINLADNNNDQSIVVDNLSLEILKSVGDNGHKIDELLTKIGRFNNDVNYNFMISLLDSFRSIKSTKKLLALKSDILKLVSDYVGDDEEEQ